MYYICYMNMRESIQERLRGFLNERPALKISVIEKEANLPYTSLHRFVLGQRDLKGEYLIELGNVLSKYGFVL